MYFLKYSCSFSSPACRRSPNSSKILEVMLLTAFLCIYLFIYFFWTFQNVWRIPSLSILVINGSLILCLDSLAKVLTFLVAFFSLSLSNWRPSPSHHWFSFPGHLPSHDYALIDRRCLKNNLRPQCGFTNLVLAVFLLTLQRKRETERERQT